MVASPRQRLILPLAPFGAAMVGAFTALMFLVMPSRTLESLVLDSGLAALIDAAQPPLGFTARALLALAGGGACAGLAWVALFVAVGTRLVIVNGPGAVAAVPTLRRADSHPDAPPRQPVFANRDLGTPFLDVRAEPPVATDPRRDAAPAPVPIGPAGERALPADLDLSLAAFDPQSFASPPAPVAQLVTARVDRPRSEPIPIRRDTSHTIDLIAAQMLSIAKPIPRADADDSTSISALLERLERSVTQREAMPPPARPESIRETLETLRGLAARTG